MRIFLGVLYFTCLAGGLASILFAIYYFMTMHQNVKARAKPFLPFTGPFQLLIPRLWSEEGNVARFKLIVSLLLFGLFFGAAILLLKVPV